MTACRCSSCLLMPCKAIIVLIPTPSQASYLKYPEKFYYGNFKILPERDSQYHCWFGSTLVCSREAHKLPITNAVVSALGILHNHDIKISTLSTWIAYKSLLMIFYLRDNCSIEFQFIS